MQETIIIGGKSYTLRNPGHLALMKEAKRLIVGDRPNPLLEAAEAIADLPANMDPKRRAVIEEEIRTIAERGMLARNRVDATDVGAFLTTREGLIFSFWQFCAEVPTFEEAVPIVEQLLKEEGEQRGTAVLQAKLDTAAELVEAKNSSGPDPKREPGPETENTDSNSGENLNSTSTLPPSTDSPPNTSTDSPPSNSESTSGQ